MNRSRKVVAAANTAQFVGEKRTVRAVHIFSSWRDITPGGPGLTSFPPPRHRLGLSKASGAAFAPNVLTVAGILTTASFEDSGFWPGSRIADRAGVNAYCRSPVKNI